MISDEDREELERYRAGGDYSKVDVEDLEDPKVAQNQVAQKQDDKSNLDILWQVSHSLIPCDPIKAVCPHKVASVRSDPHPYVRLRSLCGTTFAPFPTPASDFRSVRPCRKRCRCPSSSWKHPRDQSSPPRPSGGHDPATPANPPTHPGGHPLG